MLSLLTLFFALFLMAQTGCTVTEAIVSDHMLAEIDAAESCWQAQGITDYRIVVRASSAWTLQTGSVTIQDGRVVDHSVSCGAALLDDTCAANSVDPQPITVETLFAEARDLVNRAASGESDAYPLEAISFEFDPVYGYPARIVSSPTNGLDAGWGLVVEEFEDLS